MDLYTKYLKKYKRYLPYIILCILVILVYIKFNKKNVPVNITNLVNAKTLIRNYKNSGNKIPNCIIQTHEYDLVPKYMFNAMKSLTDMNNRYSYIYFNGKDRRNFLSKYFPELLTHYDSILPGAFKADIFRYCYLYINGGVYIDAGMVSLVPLIINPDDTFVCAEDDKKGDLYNAFIACTPGHPIIKATIDRVHYNIKNKIYGKNALSITGPNMFGKVFKEVMNIDKVLENTEFSNGIIIIETDHRPKEETGYVLRNKIPFLLTKYPNYYSDQKWYVKSIRYCIAWGNCNVYKEDINYPVYLNWLRK